MATQLPLLNLSLPDGQRFESFYTSSANELTVKEIKASTLDPEHQQLFIWGSQHTGKSHLLQACCHQAFSQKLMAAYIPLSTMKQHGTEVFTGASAYSLICIDDVDAVLGNDVWELALFNLINQSRELNQTLIFSASENPRHFNSQNRQNSQNSQHSQNPQNPQNPQGCQLADLQSRLLWGACYQLHELNEDDKTEALKFRASQRGIVLENSVIEYIYKRYPRDFTTLIEILKKLDKESLSSQRRITIPLAKQALNTLKDQS